MFKKILLSFLSYLALGLLTANAQFGVSYHQSGLPFIGFNYTIADRLMPEFRLGTDSEFDYVSLEGVLTYQYLKKEDYSLYAGIGFYYQEDQAVSIPVGMLIFPFENKNFGFHIEATPLLGEWQDGLRGSWGIRYRFGRKE